MQIKEMQFLLLCAGVDKWPNWCSASPSD